MELLKKNGSKASFDKNKVTDTFDVSTAHTSLKVDMKEAIAYVMEVLNTLETPSTQDVQNAMISYAKSKSDDDRMIDLSNQLIMNDLHHIEKRPFEKIAKVSKVTKRSGCKDHMDLSKIVKKAEAATDGIHGVSAAELIVDLHISSHL